MSERIQVLFDREKPSRLDHYIVSLNLPELYSRTCIEKLIASGGVLVNQLPAKKSVLLKTGDRLSLQLPAPQPQDIHPQDIPLDIIFEDEYLAILDKPIGIVVHPGFGNPDNTLVNAIVYRFGDRFCANGVTNSALSQTDDDPLEVNPAQAGNLSFPTNDNARPGIVHRLDKDTSGLMIIAKDDASQAALSTMFAQRQIKKTYLTVTTGIPDPAVGRIETGIGRSHLNPRKMIVTADGKWAATNYRILRYYHYFALVEVDLETGRMHQIRVHFAHRHCPVLGDLLYNSLKQVQAVIPDNMRRKATELLTHHLTRQALHAWKISFIHPYTHQPMEFSAPPPLDFIYTLNWLEQHFAVDTEGYSQLLF